MRIILSLAILACVFFPVNAYAETTIAVVDVDRILQEADAAKNLQTKRNKARETFLSELSSKEQELRKKSEELFKKQKELDEKEFVEERKKYEANLLEVRKLTQSRKRAFEEASVAALQKLRDSLTTVVQEIAEERDYSLVISARDVITGEKSLDITEDALKEMNKRVSDIPFKIEE